MNEARRRGAGDGAKVGFKTAARWNLVATARHGMGGAALADLAHLGRFRHTSYPGVLIGSVASSDASQFLGEAWAREPNAFRHLHRVTPVEVTTPFVGDDVTETLCLALEREAARLHGLGFYVRARLRGLKGRVEGQAVERAIGGFLWQRSVEAGAEARITFGDPDVVVAVEVIGKNVGYALLDRETLTIPLVRPR
jgi:tRNA(Ser,Leu) C12 N-acetylase TAN1